MTAVQPSAIRMVQAAVRIAGSLPGFIGWSCASCDDFARGWGQGKCVSGSKNKTHGTRSVGVRSWSDARRASRGGVLADAALRIDLIEADGDALGDALFLHGDAVEDVGDLHGALRVGDDDELGLVEE